MKRLFASTFFLLITFYLSGCDGSEPNDSANTVFSVRYEVRGTCNGLIGPNMMSIGYTVDGGGSEGKTVTAPWAETFMIDASTTFGGVGLSANCLGSGAVPNTVTAEIFVNDASAALTTDTDVGLVSVNANAALR